MKNLTDSLNLNRDEKLELIRLLDEKERRRKENPLAYNNPFIPKRHEKQIAFHTNNKRIRAFFGGNRTGKTEAGGHEVVCYAEGKHEFRKIKFPCEIWVGCPSFDVQKDTTQKKIERYLSANSIDKINYIHTGIWKEVFLKDGSKITFKSYEQGREKWQGAGKQLIWFDEEPPYDIWEEALMRHEAGTTLDVILTMTPVNGMTWVYDEIYMATDRDDLFVITAGWDDNPYLTEEQKQDMGRNLSEDSLKVRKKGEFVSRVGLVCSWWNRDKHLKNIIPQNNWTYYEVIDGGWSDPAAYLLVAVTDKGEWKVVSGFRERELMEEQIFTKREQIRGNLLIRGGVADNDNPRLIRKLGELGMDVVPISKVTDETRGSWDEQLAEALFSISNRLEIDKSLSWLVQEIENLKWLELNKKTGLEIKPTWDDHRRFGHHFDGIRALAYLITSEMVEPIKIKVNPLEGKVPGSYVRTSIEENNDSDVYTEQDFGQW